MKKRICISILSGLLFLSALNGTVMAADTTGSMADSCEGRPAEYIADPAGAVTFDKHSITRHSLIKRVLRFSSTSARPFPPGLHIRPFYIGLPT